MGMEYEWKYAADADVHQHIRADYPGDWHAIAMETTYYDTPSGDLSQKRCTLRLRLENRKSICTLKTPGIGTARGEWDMACSSIQTAFPELCKLSEDSALYHLDPSTLTPVCGARFTRQCLTLNIGDATVELALDKGILFSATRQTPLCEIEIELKSGDIAAAQAFALLLAGTYALRPEPLSKFARARSLNKE